MIDNPIGIIINKISPDKLIDIITTINPLNKLGKIVLITEMNEKLEYNLPKLIRIIQNFGINIVWSCKVNNKEDIFNFFNIHRIHGSKAGGIYLQINETMDYENSIKLIFYVAKLIKND
jgi:3-deoxy-D-arabino-heptulosonate 7-phosphate (DAHP) synthase class II